MDIPRHRSKSKKIAYLEAVWMEKKGKETERAFEQRRLWMGTCDVPRHTPALPH